MVDAGVLSVAAEHGVTHCGHGRQSTDGVCRALGSTEALRRVCWGFGDDRQQPTPNAATTKRAPYVFRIAINAEFGEKC
jgi:hypothetical protein